MTRLAFLRWLLLALVAAPLAACGKKGRLEAPEDADPAASDVVLPRIRQGH
jgi:predicted small lipoprotein YifL